MTIRLADGTTTFLDFRERAPLAATNDMYLDAKGEPVRRRNRPARHRRPRFGLAPGTGSSGSSRYKSWSPPPARGSRRGRSLAVRARPAGHEPAAAEIPGRRAGHREREPTATAASTACRRPPARRARVGGELLRRRPPCRLALRRRARGARARAAPPPRARRRQRPVESGRWPVSHVVRPFRPGKESPRRRDCRAGPSGTADLQPPLPTMTKPLTRGPLRYFPRPRGKRSER